jgi:hypothetical protein
MSDRRNQNYPFAVSNRRSRKPTDGPIEKLLILIQLDDMIAWRSAG